MDEPGASLDRGRPRPDVWYLAGPTASGKSSVALALAGQLDAEIISVDSMQVYRGLDIGTAKPTAQELAGVRHHLIDIAPLDIAFDAASFCRHAEEALGSIRSRGKRAIFCGGTGLYFKAWMEGVGRMPSADPELRAALSAQPLEELLRELELRDPDTFARIDRKNPRRVIRALEVVRLTGKSFVGQQSAWNSGGSISTRPDFYYLDRQPADLQARIRSRVDAMLASGWMDEARWAMGVGLERNRTAFQAIGYRLLIEHLRGQRGLTETQELIRIRTRQFARSQGIWFRKHADVIRVSVEADESPDSVASRILEMRRRADVL